MSTVTDATRDAAPSASSRRGRASDAPAAKGDSVGDVAVSGFSHLFLVRLGRHGGAAAVVGRHVVVQGPTPQILKNPLSMIPDGLHWDNFSRAWTQRPLRRRLPRHVIIVGGGVFLTMLLGSMAAYVLARYEFPGNRVIYYLFLAGLTLPVYMAAVPLFKGIDNMGNICRCSAQQLRHADPRVRRLVAVVHDLLHALVLPHAAARGRRGGAGRRLPRTPRCSSG